MFLYMVDDIPLTEVGHLESNSFFNDPNGGRFSIFAPRVIDNAIFQKGVPLELNLDVEVHPILD